MSNIESAASIDRGSEYLDQKTDEEHTKELSLLTPFEYDRVRLDKAGELNIQVTTLDKAVKEGRKDIDTNNLNLKIPAPWETSVNGAELLDDIINTLNRFIVFPENAPQAIALWILFTYIYDVMRICPILLITSPEKRCGKTNTMSLLIKLANKAIPASNISQSALFRTTEKYKPTLLVDEADTFLKNNEDLQGILNSGHTKDMAYVVRNVGDDHEPKLFSTWSPKAIAAIGKIKDTLLDRSIIVSMRRKKPIEKVGRLRDFDGTEIKRKCIRWAQDNIESLKKHIPDIPDSLHDRAADNWEPLISIADIVGGQWPDVSRKIAVNLASIDEEDDTAKIQLLKDIKSIFDNRNTDRLWTKETLESLNNMDERSWSEWRRGKGLSARNLSQLLGAFGIHSKDVRIDLIVKKGYLLEDFKDSLARYIPQLNATELQSSGSNTFSDIQNATQNVNVADKKPLKHAPDKGCSVVADKAPLMEALGEACDGLSVTPEQVKAKAVPEDYEDFINYPDVARSFAESVNESLSP